MATTIVGGKYNQFTTSFNAAAKTLAISGCTAFDLVAADIESIYDTTTTSYFVTSQTITCARTLVSGLPVFTFTFSSVPAGAANSDTMVIRLQIPDKFADHLLLQVLANATP